MKRDFSFILFYLLLLSVHVYAGQWGVNDPFRGNFFEAVTFYTKPLLLISLIGWFIAYRKWWSGGSFEFLLLAGLFFSWCGDVLLLWQGASAEYFTLGLGAFLLAHIAYIAAFTRTHRHDHEVALLRQQGWLLVVVVGYGVYFFGQLAPSLGSLMAPVMLYTLAITVMMLIALNRFGKVCDHSFWPIVWGAALFVASDSVLAWNKFAEPLPYAHALIMGTYGLAQLLIVYGAVQQVRDMKRQSGNAAFIA